MSKNHSNFFITSGTLKILSNLDPQESSTQEVLTQVQEEEVDESIMCFDFGRILNNK